MGPVLLAHRTATRNFYGSEFYDAGVFIRIRVQEIPYIIGAGRTGRQTEGLAGLREGMGHQPGTDGVVVHEGQAAEEIDPQLQPVD